MDGQIFPAVCTGFTDTVPGMREQTVKSMIQIAGRLSENTIDNQLLKFLAKSQMDPEAPIRTNTTICISKISCHFSDATRRKVLIPAFLRALKDPFMHARNAGLLSLGCTAQYYGEPEVASRILPALCPMLMDHDKMVREQALKTVKLFIEKIERYHKGNPDKAPVSNRPSGREQTESGQEAPKGWTSWAVSSVSNIATKYTGQSGGASNNIGEIQKPVSAKPTPAPAAAAAQSSAPNPGATKPAPTTVTTPRESHQSDEMSGSGWDDDWDDIKSPSVPKAKTSLKLGGVKAKTSALDDDDTFVANILKEEQGHLKKQGKGVKPSASLSRPKSPEITKSSSAPAPWDAPQKTVPQNNKVKLTPWEEPPQNSQNKDILSSYFSNSSSDFFGEMGVDSDKSKSASGPVKSEWDDFNIKTVEPEPDNDWNDWGSEEPKVHQSKPTSNSNGGGDWGGDDEDWSDNWETSKPLSKPAAPKSSFKPVKKTASPAFNKPAKKTASPAFNQSAKKTASPAFDDWNDSGWDEMKPAAKPAKPATSFKPVQKPTQPAKDSWDNDDWGDLSATKNVSKPAKTSGFQPAKTSSFQPAAAKSSGGSGFDNWDDGWNDAPLSREERRKQQRERRGNRANRGGRLGAAKKD